MSEKFGGFEKIFDLCGMNTTRKISYEHFDRSDVYPHRLSVSKQQTDQWRTRLLCEFASSPMTLNVVLTCKRQEDVMVDGKIDGTHLQKFWKRLRRWLDYHSDDLHLPQPPHIKYFQVSEFGEKNTRRLHFHVMIFFDTLCNFWAVSAAIEKLWYFGITHVRSMSPRHAFYNTKYIQKKFFLPYYKSQSQGIGVEHARKVAEFAWLHDNKFRVYGYERSLTRYQRSKVYTENQVLELRQRYIRKCESLHNSMIAFNNNTSSPLYVTVKMTLAGMNKAREFLQTYYCTDDWIDAPDLPNLFSKDVVPLYTWDMSDDEIGQKWFYVTWHGIFAKYFVEHMRDEIVFNKLKNGII